MVVTADSKDPAEVRTDLLVVPHPELDGDTPKLRGRPAAIDRANDGALSAAVESGDFRGKRGQTALVYPGGNARRVLLVGVGPEKDLDADGLRHLAGTAAREGAARRASKVTLAVPRARRVRAGAAGQALAEGAVLGGYRYDAFKENDADGPREVAALQLCFDKSADLRAARQGVKRGVVLAESQNVARDLSNAPGNALPPAALAREAQRVAKETGLRARVFAVAELEKRKMGGILAVGGGSANTPRLIVMEHKPKRLRKGAKTLCFVGKGITFDSGGISIKPSPQMDEMKHDMSGAAAVVGALRACALLDVPHHVVGVIAAAENLPSGTAYRPGDVVTTASGKTVEILNTDAEGRVVLADALHYAVTEYDLAAMVDLATLTGACVVALGRWATGAFGNSERLVDALRESGESVGERVWPMPLLPEHRRAMKSEIADLKNAGAGREAGASTAAGFLAAFVGETPWVHLDIAGTGWTGSADAIQPKGATGVGVRLLLDLVDGWRKLKL